MRLESKSGRRSADIDVGAFADIAFLLIIFFILTTTFIRPFGHKLNIPSGTTDVAKKEEKQLTINLKPGQIAYGEQSEQLTVDELRMRLARVQLLKRKPEKRLVIVECAQNVPYEQYFQVVMAVTDAGGVLALIEEEDKGNKK